MMTGNLAELRVVGGHPALDLANTVTPRPPAVAEFEFLSDPAALLAWATRVELVDTKERSRIERSWSAAPGSADAALADVLRLRASTDRLLAGQEWDTLLRRWAAAVSRSTLVPAPPGARLVVGTEPATMIADRLADALVDLLRHADLARLRTCPLDEGGCGWLFLDRSRNLSRRWCSMEDCGAQAKSRRLTERRRARR